MKGLQVSGGRPWQTTEDQRKNRHGTREYRIRCILGRLSTCYTVVINKIVSTQKLEIKENVGHNKEHVFAVLQSGGQCSALSAQR